MLTEILSFGAVYATPAAAVAAAALAAWAARRAQQGAKSVGEAREEAVAELTDAGEKYARAVADFKSAAAERDFFRDQMSHYVFEAAEQKRLCTECHDELRLVTNQANSNAAELEQLKLSIAGVQKLLSRPDVLEVLMRSKP